MMKTSTVGPQQLVWREEQLPADYPHDFAPRLSETRCCVVIRLDPNGNPHIPRRCAMRRQAGKTSKEPRRQTCKSHAAMEHAAKKWMEEHG